MTEDSPPRPRSRDVSRPASTASLAARVTELVEPLARADDLELVDVEVRGSHGSRVVRVVADAEDGLDVERIAALSRQLEDQLDARGLIDGGYTLEVSSPGLDEPLHSPADFARTVGRDVRVLRNQARPEGEPGEVVGTVKAVSERGVTLEIEGRPQELSLEEIEHGKVVLPW